MKHEYIKYREGNPGLVLLFGGWGSGPELFEEYEVPQGYDFLLCYDYRDMSFDFSLLDGYSKVRLVAWSMGVWAAGTVFGTICRLASGKDGGFVAEAGTGMVYIPWESRIAIGGTPFPVDNEKGIPEAIFDGTLAGLSWITLEKFRRRMCGPAQEHFMAHVPHRKVDELKEELDCIGKAVRGQKCHPEDFGWDMAIVGGADMIFPVASQKNAWESLGTEVRLIKRARHYDPDVFREILNP